MLLYVGRFTEVKRVGLLIEAYADAQPGFARRSPLVLVGGFPGEWEGEHPFDAVAAPARATSSWPAGTATTSCPSSSPPATRSCSRRCASSSARCSSRAMACGLPCIAVDAYGPADIVDDGETGWLVEGDDRITLANALVHAVNCPQERRRRGDAACRTAREHYSWPALADEVAGVYADARRGAFARGI